MSTLRVTFLGTSGSVPTTERNPSAIHINRAGDQLLFDCGEGTQRQMMHYGTGFTVERIFLTHLHGDHVFGLPGLLQTWDFNDRTTPLTIYTPQGTDRTIRSITSAGGTNTSYPVRVESVAPGDVAYRGSDYEIRGFRTEHRTKAVGYALVEDERKGRFDREHAEALGVPVGPKFSKLHAGESVELDDGTVIDSEQVVGPPRPGRRLVYTGDTRPTDSVIDVATDADVLIHDATFGDEYADRAAETGHSTAREAAEIAAAAGVSQLVLTHISSRYTGDASMLTRQASEPFDGEVTLAHDGLELDVPYPESS